MAIQIPNPGTGNGASGDNEFVLWSKVKSNFEDQTNAASRLIGIGNTLVPTGRDVFSSAFSSIDVSYITAGQTVDFNELPVGKRIFVISTATMLNAPVGYVNTSWIIETSALYSMSVGTGATGGSQQIAYGYGRNTVLRRTTTRAIAEKAGWTAWQPISVDPNAYTSTNTTKDSNGFIKAASPIVKVFSDKVELNGEAVDQDVSYKKNGVGDYTITTVSGLSTDGWYIELPKDMNGNPKVAVTLEETDGVISLKTYKRIFSMETFTFEPDLDNPLDIPDTRWIDLRLNEIPVEMPDDTQTEV